MQTLLSAPLRPDVMARRISFRQPVPDAGEEYEAPVLGHWMAAWDASPQNGDHYRPESTIDLPPPNDLGHWRRLRAIICTRRALVVDPSYRASRETHSPVPCGAGLRAVDLG